MALSTPALELVIDELVLDGVEPGDSAVRDSVALALGPALAEHGFAGASADVTSAVTSAVAQGVAR